MVSGPMELEDSVIELARMKRETAPGLASGLPRHVQLVIVAIIAALTVAGFAFGPALYRVLFVKEVSTQASSHSETVDFQLTPQQWATVKTQAVREIVFQPERQAEGKIAIADDNTTAVFPPYNGRVTAIFAREGERVEQGQPLFRMDSTDLVQAQNDLVTATATLAKAQNQLNLQQTIEQRMHKLFDIHGAALKDWQQAQADLTSAQNDQKSAQIALMAAQDRLHILGQSDKIITQVAESGRTTTDLNVPAPISGFVLQRKLGIGQYLSQGATDSVFTIGNLSSVWLVANVRESDAPFVQVGQPVEVRVTAYPDKVFEAKITYVAASVDANTHRLPIRAEVANTDGLLKPEMWANFSIATGASRKALAVPEQAIIYEGDSARVWVADKDHALKAHEIVTGITNGKNVEIISGVTAGDDVLTQGSIFIDRAATSE